MIEPVSQKRILIIEPEAVLADVMVDALELDGFQTLVAGRIDEAERILLIHRVDLVLADLWGPVYDGDGWSEVARLRGLGRGTPIVIATAHAEAVDEDPVRRGVADILAKPFDLDDFLARVGRALESGCRCFRSGG